MGPTRAATSLRWPMPFSLQPGDEAWMPSARRCLDLHHDFADTPERVHRTFLGFVGEPPWSPGFRGVDWWTPAGRLDGAVMDELYLFMAMRVHVIEHALGRRSVAYVSRWSLPLATRMVQVIETTRLPGGLTRLRYRVAFDPPRLFAPLVAPVEWAFARWFQASFRGLARYLQAHPEPAPAEAPGQVA